MSHFTQTDARPVPHDWRVSTLGEVCVFENGDRGSNYPSPGSFVASGVPFINAGHVSDGKIDLADMNYITPESYGRLGAGKVRVGDIVFCLRGSLGKFGVVPDGFGDGAIASSLVIVRPKGVAVAREYLSCYFGSELCAQMIETWSGGAAQPNLGAQDLARFLVRLPPTQAEQRAIAAALSDVDALLDGLTRLIAKKRDIKQAAMQQLLTGQTRLPGFHGEWEVVQVQDVIAESFCGPSPTCEEREVEGGREWGVLKTTAATKENGWDWTKHKALPEPYWGKKALELRRGDVIVTKAGPRHRVGVSAWVNYVPPRIIPSGKMIALRPRPEKCVPLMLAAAIAARDAQAYLDQRTTGMAESQVNFENVALLQAPIRMPRIDEQLAIAEVHFDMDAELDALEARRDKTRLLKQGMMQELLTGRTRLI